MTEATSTRPKHIEEWSELAQLLYNLPIPVHEHCTPFAFCYYDKAWHWNNRGRPETSLFCAFFHRPKGSSWSGRKFSIGRFEPYSWFLDYSLLAGWGIEGLNTFQRIRGPKRNGNLGRLIDELIEDICCDRVLGDPTRGVR